MTRHFLPLHAGPWRMPAARGLTLARWRALLLAMALAGAVLPAAAVAQTTAPMPGEPSGQGGHTAEPSLPAAAVALPVTITFLDSAAQGNAPLEALVRRELAARFARAPGPGELDSLLTQAATDVRLLLETEGYYEARVDAARAAGLPVLRIRLNAPVLVSALRLEVRGALRQPPAELHLNAADGERDWLLPVGRVFRHADWENAKRRLLQQALLRGYPLARLTDSVAEVDPPTRSVRLHVVLDSGPLVRLGPLEISGLQRYPRRVIDGANTLRMGAPFTQDALFALQRRIQQTAFFERVEVSLATPEAPLPGAEAPGEIVVPVRVRVTEFPARRVSLGAGYSTNTGARLQAGYGHLNPRDSATRFDGALVLESRQQNVHGDIFLDPSQPGYLESVGARLRREDIGGEVVHGASINARRAWGPEDIQRNLTVGLLVEQRRIGALQTTPLAAAVASHGVLLRRVDNRLAPQRGMVLEAQVGVGLRLTDRQDPFTRFYGRGTFYQPWGAANTVVLRAEGGVVGAGQRAGIPAEWLFRAGGDLSVRGYAYQSLGVAENGAVVGGRYLLTGSAEVIHWLGSGTRTWGVAAFVDAGDAADSVKTLHPAIGLGLGARWRSPVGPLQLDLAYGRQVRKLRLHASLGVSF